MSETVKVDSGKTTFDFGDGVTLVADTFKLQRQLHEVSEKAIEANETHYQYIDRVIAFVKETYGADLTDGQAEWLNMNIVTHNTSKKKAWLAPLNELAGSATATASTASPPED